MQTSLTAQAVGDALFTPKKTKGTQIMLKLNTAYAKKVPAETEYSSQSYHVCMEVELSDGLTPEQIEAKIHENFDLLRKSVEDELKNNSTPNQPALLPAENVPNAPQMNPAQQNKNGYGKKNGTTSEAPASPKQVKYLLDLARQFGINPEQIKAKFNVHALESLTKTDESSYKETP